jgi:hypothetical protein
MPVPDERPRNKNGIVETLANLDIGTRLGGAFAAILTVGTVVRIFGSSPLAEVTAGAWRG